MTDNQQEPLRKKRSPRKILLWWTGTLAALVIAAEMFTVFATGVHLNGKESAPYMRDVAQQLKTDPDWKLVSDESTMHPYSCLVWACPEMTQTWDLGMDSVSCSELHQLLSDSGYKVITRRSNYTPQANEEAERCARLMNSVSSDAEAAWGLVRIEAVVYPPSTSKGSEREHYELKLRVIK